MKLDWIKLSNFRNHRNALFQFSEGINAIVGHNGAGKSSVIEALVFLLTGNLNSNKAEVITSGEIAGYAECQFDFSGKKAILHKALESSKTILEYDDVVYKKASEVKELLDKLFMLTPDILEGVIIASQGKISSIFDGDYATRLKLFQKIFVVPDVSKIRSKIWDNYIKEAPPMYLEEDIQVIEVDEAVCDGAYVLAKEEYEGMSLKLGEMKSHLEMTMGAYKTYVRYLDSLERSKKAVEESKNLKIQLTKLQGSIVKIPKRLNLESLKQEFEKCSNWEKYVSARNSLMKSIIQNKETIKEMEASYTKITLDEVNSIYEALLATSDKVKEIEHKLNHSGVCSECKRPLDFKLSDKERQDLEEQLQALKEAYTSLEAEYNTKENALFKYERAQAEVAVYKDILEGLEKELNALKEYPECLRTTLDVQEDIRSLQEKEALNKSILKDIDVVNHKLESLSSIVTEEAIPTDIEEIKRFMSERESLQADYELKEKEAAKLITVADTRYSTEKESIVKRKAEAARAKKLNDRRAKYLNILQGVYDCFHTTKFPSALIKRYTGTVEEYLQNRLRQFNFPYTVGIMDDFSLVFKYGIDSIPKISEGQKILVGLALRLALHDMFGNAFPFLVIDEGTTHLDKSNRDIYFSIIEGLKTYENKQVIIIDHAPELEGKADNVITLGGEY